jgi:hypothetical protein
VADGPTPVPAGVRKAATSSTATATFPGSPTPPSRVSSISPTPPAPRPPTGSSPAASRPPRRPCRSSKPSRFPHEKPRPAGLFVSVCFRADTFDGSMTKLRAWIAATRPKTLVAAVAPIALGGAVVVAYAGSPGPLGRCSFCLRPAQLPGLRARRAGRLQFRQ